MYMSQRTPVYLQADELIGVRALTPMHKQAARKTNVVVSDKYRYYFTLYYFTV